MSGGVLQVCAFQVSTQQRPACSTGLRFRGISCSVSSLSHAGFGVFHLLPKPPHRAAPCDVLTLWAARVPRASLAACPHEAHRLQPRGWKCDNTAGN